MERRKYYEAYDDRYRQIHERRLQWASDAPSAIVTQIMSRFGISGEAEILELGCGEGRDASHLLRQGYRITATDISPEAIRYCRAKNPAFRDCFQVLDCVAGEWNKKYDFIYAVAVIHMLVKDEDRTAFYRFIREHLKESGAALVCSMGDGTVERCSDISTAFDLQQRTHEKTGEKMLLAGTSCRMVNWDTCLSEIRENGLSVAESGLTEVPPDFPVMMYAVAKTKQDTFQ
jgi:cyclopropane fatty-acyl-phospholipid synthase-like methyltransferase